MTKTILAGLLAAMVIPQMAAAETKLRGEIFCFPAKDVPKIVDNLKEVSKARRDVAVVKPSGYTPTFIDKVYANKDSDVCVADKTRAARPEYDEGLYFEMGLSPLFHNNSGRHDMAELKEGTKDGKRFYKKMIPAAVRLFMPDTDYLAIKYDDMRLTGGRC